MSEHEAHAHHWEWSYYPLILVAGIFFAIPIAFSFMFHEPMHNGTIAAICLGVGVPLILWGCVGWAGEGIDNAANETGWSLTGLPLFICSEILIFMALFTSYWLLRLTAGDNWPPEGSPEIGLTVPFIMTIILVSSSFTYHIGEGKLEEGDNAGFRKWLIITLVLGTVFLSLTGYEYNHLLHEGWGWSADAKSTAFYSITGFHASHVLVGLVMFAIILVPAMSNRISHVFVTAAGVYWHFVDIVWFFVVSQIYIW